MKGILGLLFLQVLYINIWAQEKTDAMLVGDVQCDNCPDKHIPFASLAIKGTSIGTAADATGHFMFTHLPEGTHVIKASAVGYLSQEKTFTISKNQTVEIRFVLAEDNINLEQVVISGTRYELDRTESPVMVNVINDHIFEATQSVSLAEGLSFQPGLRLENNCQNCGFSQVRMNGLQGPYTQILVNSRPIFSALQGVYGLDQIPANMIERVEIVRGGGSALYGGNAIAGTINIITKDPVINSYQISSQLSLIDGRVPDYNLNANLSLVNDDLNTGLNLYGMYRDRDHFDANGDAFSEITLMQNHTLGGKAFFKPNQKSKISLDFHAINDYRRGGNLFNRPAHQADVTEQIGHQIFGGGLAYEMYNPSMTNKLSVYTSLQSIKRESYYGAGGNLDNFDPDRHFQDDNGNFISLTDYLFQQWGRSPNSEEVSLFGENLRLELARQAASYYGQTDDLAWVTGAQWSQSLDKANITTGLEYRLNRVTDRMPGYERLIDQEVSNLGAYFQYEYKPNPALTLLAGLRYDYNVIEGIYDLFDESLITDSWLHALNPRFNLLYKPNPVIQLRGSYARGFRTPQAFDEDLHIETVGGAAQFIRMSPDLEQETSDALTLSSEFRPAGLNQFSFLVEGFYTRLYNPFVNVGLLEGDGQTPGILEKRNASETAIVSGINLESRFAPSKKFNLQVGGTVQEARYSDPIELYTSEDTDGEAIFEDRLLRTPALYGYFVSSIQLLDALEMNISGTYTGSMAQPYESGLQRPLGIYDTQDFFELNVRFCYDIEMPGGFLLELETGMQNLFNSYQRDFDVGAERDVAYIYGPNRPRTVFFGVKMGSF
ncbi:MAG: TonB-dependent receptor [Candidatus Cyclobacteriaceae bacterium M3_2C_046]